MANLEFYDTHNMVAYLKKIEGSEGFHQIVDFLNSSHIRTLDNREMEITAIIDGKVKIVSEASIRRHLKLEDSGGISNLPTTEMFEQLALMGYGLVVQGEGSTVPVESHHTPTSAPSTSQPPISSPSRRLTRQESVVPQPRSPTQTNVADEAASIDVDVRLGGATTTVTGLEAGQGSGNIDKTSTMPHDLPLPRVHTLESDKGRIQHNELMDLVTKLSDRVVKKLEKSVKTKQARRKARIIVSDKEEDLEDPSKQGRKIAEINQDPNISLVQHDEKPVSTADASVSTTGASSAKDNGKAIIEEAETIPTKTKLQLEQERLGYEEALRLQDGIDEEERDYNQRKESEAKKARLITELINKRKRYFAAQRSEERRKKPLTQAQQRTYMSQYIKNMGSHTLKQLKSYSLMKSRICLKLQ
ncbi:hypothetical protein Tco_1421597 [Tanacetum coccineum]